MRTPDFHPLPIDVWATMKTRLGIDVPTHCTREAGEPLQRVRDALAAH